MKPKFNINLIMLLILLSWLPIAQAAETQSRTGFLVLAPDRGFLGNREVKKSFLDSLKSPVIIVSVLYNCK